MGYTCTVMFFVHRRELGPIIDILNYDYRLTVYKRVCLKYNTLLCGYTLDYTST